MNYQSDPLWLRIRDFPFDEPGVAFPFSKKLSKEQKWTEEFADVAITEYRKFIYLCCISPKGASPSEVVDEVWHLHLTYTVNYWTKFCKETLHKDIHHHPSQGGSNEKEKHNNWYRDTILLYRNTFNENPPQSIWPAPPPDFVIPETNQLLPEKTFDKKLYFLFVIPFIVITIFYRQAIPFLLSGPHYLVFFILIAACAIYIAYHIRIVNRQHFLRYLFANNHDLNNYKLAFLMGGHSRYILLHLSRLIRDEILVHKKKDIYLIDRIKARNSDNSIAFKLSYHEKEAVSYKDISLLITTESDELRDLRQLKSKFTGTKRNLLIGIVAGLFAIPRIIQGANNDKPVIFLGLICFAAVIILFVMLSNFHYDAERFFRKNSQFTSNINDDIASNIIFSGVAGIVGIHMFSHLNTRHYNFNDNSSGCGSSGCGSSCGGGGGCGGCGGD